MSVGLLVSFLSLGATLDPLWILLQKQRNAIQIRTTSKDTLLFLLSCLSSLGTKAMVLQFILHKYWQAQLISVVIYKDTVNLSKLKCKIRSCISNLCLRTVFPNWSKILWTLIQLKIFYPLEKLVCSHNLFNMNIHCWFYSSTKYLHFGLVLEWECIHSDKF